MDKKDEQKLVKPLGLIRKELQENIIKSVNESELPLSMVSYILKDILDQINLTVVQQDNAEISQYEAKLAELNSKE